MGTKLTLSILIACGLAYALYIPFPEVCDFPSGIKAGFLVVEGVKFLGSISFAFTGNYFGAFGGKTSDNSNIRELTVTTTHIAGVEVRIYRPTTFAKTGPGPVMIYFHGGGWTVGSIDSYKVQTVAMAKETGMLVVVPEYRLSPKYPFPAAFDDAMVVTQEFLKNAKKYDVDSKKVVLAGDSAGGNLATAVSLAIGKKNSPNPICMANLIYPTLQAVNFRTPSYLQNPYGPLLDNWFMMRFFLNYMGLEENMELSPLLLMNAHMNASDHSAIFERVSAKWVPAKYKKRPLPEVVEMIPEEGYESMEANIQKIQKIATDYRLSPLVADDSLLKVLPRMHTVTCEYDPLRDDGVSAMSIHYPQVEIILHERMQSLGLNSSLVNWEFGAHGLFQFYGVFKYEKLDTAVRDMLRVITEAVEKC